MLFPVQDKYLAKCRFSSGYGSRIHPIRKTPDGHRAIDIAMPVNTPLIAIEDGTILFNRVNAGGAHRGYGYYLVIKHDNGYYSLLAHLVRRSNLKDGAKVKKGQIVAYSGNTGSSTGPHLHFEIHKGQFLFRSQIKGKDTAIDPVEIYPQLKGMLGKWLTGMSFEGDDDKLDDKIKIRHKGKLILVDGYLKEGHHYVQLREVLEALGFKVEWDGPVQEVVVK